MFKILIYKNKLDNMHNLSVEPAENVLKFIL